MDSGRGIGEVPGFLRFLQDEPGFALFRVRFAALPGKAFCYAAT